MVDKYMEPSKPAYHGRLAISSFIVSIVAAIVIFMDFGFAVYSIVNDRGSMGVENLVDLFIIFSGILLILSTALGIAALFDRKSKKILSILGLIISGFTIFIFGIMFFGINIPN